MSLPLATGLRDLATDALLRQNILYYLSPIVALLAWRLWRFTIQPRLDPSAPKELPYWIPFVGPAYLMLTNLYGIVSQARYCGDTFEPFSIIVFGQRLYFVQSEQDMDTILRGACPDLTHEDHVRDLLKMFGSSPQGLHAMYLPPAPSSSSRDNPKQKPLALLAEGFMNKQLLSVAELQSLMNRIGHVIDKRTRWDAIPSAAIESSNLLQEGVVSKKVSLLRWSQYAILEAMTTAWFGEVIYELSSTVLPDMIRLDHEIWKLFYQLPRPWSSVGHDAAASLRSCLLKYVQLDPSKKKDRCWAAQVAEEEMRARGIAEEDMASHLLMVFWGVNANIFKTAFWLLSYVVSDPTISNKFKDEVSGIVSNMDSKDPSTISKELDSSPFSAALFHETVRLTTNSSSERTILRDCVINGKSYKAGGRIMLLYRYLALSPAVSGTDPDVFRPERFLKVDEQDGDVVVNNSLARSRSFVPFASGAHKCPGRVVTRKISLMFAALIVHRFSIKPLNGLPPLELARPPLGAIEVPEGMDLHVVVRPIHKQ